MYKETLEIDDIYNIVEAMSEEDIDFDDYEIFGSETDQESFNIQIIED